MKMGDHVVRLRRYDVPGDVFKQLEFTPEQLTGDFDDVCERLGIVDPPYEHPFDAPV